MAIINKRAWNPEKVPDDVKHDFFKKLRDLCCLYGVHISEGEIEFPKHLKSEDDPDMIPAVFFEFYDGSTYSWWDGELDYSNCNSFENIDNEDDVITLTCSPS